MFRVSLPTRASVTAEAGYNSSNPVAPTDSQTQIPSLVAEVTCDGI
jgi:hypothetical protein